MLLLDEAMAGLTQREVQLAIDLVRDIHRSGITLVIVEHIMEVIMSLASRVVVFHQGREIARGSPREVTGNPAVIEAYLGKRAAKAAAGHTPIELMGGPRMTAPLLRIEHLEVRYGDLIGVSDVSLEVPEGSVVALLGSNGGGKTTTLNAIAGLIPVHSGSIAFRGEEIGGADRVFDRARRDSRCRRKAGGCSCSRASRTICCSARRRCATRRAPRRCSSASTKSFQRWPSGAASVPAPCPAASGRCWRSAAR